MAGDLELDNSPLLPSNSHPTLPGARLFRGKAVPRQATKELRRQAQHERQHLTLAERSLWQQISSRQLQGLKFRCQHIALGYILDFYCPEYRLAVEIDGPSHNPERDLRRDQMLSNWDVLVLRFPASKPTDEIVLAIRAVVRSRQLAFIHNAATAMADVKAISRSADWYATRRSELQRQKIALNRKAVIAQGQLELPMPSSVKKLASTEPQSLALKGLHITERRKTS
jgi:very-short-patch-repair endonuclease